MGMFHYKPTNYWDTWLRKPPDIKNGLHQTSAALLLRQANSTFRQNWQSLGTDKSNMASWESHV